MLLYFGKMDQGTKVFVDSEFIISRGIHISFLKNECKVFISGL